MCLNEGREIQNDSFVVFFHISLYLSKSLSLLARIRIVGLKCMRQELGGWNAGGSRGMGYFLFHYSGGDLFFHPNEFNLMSLSRSGRSLTKCDVIQ